jgi:hypothetical protein
MLLDILMNSRLWHAITHTFPPYCMSLNPTSIYHGQFPTFPAVMKHNISNMVVIVFTLTHCPEKRSFIAELRGQMVKYDRDESTWFVRSDIHAMWLDKTVQFDVDVLRRLDMNPKPVYNAILITEGGMRSFESVWGRARQDLLPLQQVKFVDWVYTQIINRKPWAFGAHPGTPNEIEYTGAMWRESFSWNDSQHAVHRASVLLRYFGCASAAD